jgi:hypothetical protein
VFQCHIKSHGDFNVAAIDKRQINDMAFEVAIALDEVMRHSLTEFEDGATACVISKAKIKVDCMSGIHSQSHALDAG